VIVRARRRTVPGAGDEHQGGRGRDGPRWKKHGILRAGNGKNETALEMVLVRDGSYCLERSVASITTRRGEAHSSTTGTPRASEVD
jgi:hypothetical protein